MTTLTADPALAAYVQGWRERAQRRAEGDAEWRRRILGRMGEVVELLRGEFGASRILLFGSFARDEARPGSDLDLLVEGIATGRLMAAASAVGRLLKEVEADLVPSQLAVPAVRERAEAEGVLLHG